MSRFERGGDEPTVEELVDLATPRLVPRSSSSITTPPVNSGRPRPASGPSTRLPRLGGRRLLSVVIVSLAAAVLLATLGWAGRAVTEGLTSLRPTPFDSPPLVTAAPTLARNTQHAIVGETAPSITPAARDSVPSPALSPSDGSAPPPPPSDSLAAPPPTAAPTSPPALLTRVTSPPRVAPVVAAIPHRLPTLQPVAVALAVAQPSYHLVIVLAGTVPASRPSTVPVQTCPPRVHRTMTQTTGPGWTLNSSSVWFGC